MTTLQYTGERVVPWSPAVGSPVMSCHLARYAWAMPHVYGRSVVDLGCGAGYGSYLMSWGAREVIGVDVSIDALAFARRWFMAGNLRYEVLDLEAAQLPSAQVYVAFEVLEHLTDPKALLNKITGTLLWSVPVNDGSKFHRQVYGLSEATDLVPGSVIWYQGAAGAIVPLGKEWFSPAHVVGLAQLV